MTVGRAVTLFAGIVILLSVILSQVHHVGWLWVTGFVGLNLFQSSFTGLCPAALLFRAMGLKPGGAFE